MYPQQKENAILISKLFLNKSFLKKLQKKTKTHNTHLGKVVYDFPG